MTDMEYEMNSLENLIRIVKAKDDVTAALVAAKGLCEVVMYGNEEPMNLLHKTAAETRQFIVDTLKYREWNSTADKKPELEDTVLCIGKDVRYDKEGNPAGDYYYYVVGDLQDWSEEGEDPFIAWDINVGYPVPIENILYWRPLPKEPEGVTWEDDDAEQ